MSEIPTPADYVTVEVAGKAAGIPARTLRYWISSGKLAAIAGKRGKLVSMGEVERLGLMVGKPVGNMATPDGKPATSAEEVAGNIAESFAESALVTDAARQQLATIRDEWLAPLIERIGELERENGRLEVTAETKDQALAAKDETIAELRRRAEAAEAEALREREAAAAAAEANRRRLEQERRNREALEAAQATQEAPGTPEPPEGVSQGLWARLGRWWRG
jgi:hypothetical protein